MDATTVFAKITTRIILNATNAINDSLDILKQEAILLSPTDTKQFINNHVIEYAQNKGWIITWSLVNKTKSKAWFPYAVALEYWVGWKSYNYHKWPPADSTTVIYSWVGNRTYARASDAKHREIMNLITKSLTK